ncbi:MAG: MBL fold metallo-hydrolase [Actinomycetota bacterium]
MSGERDWEAPGPYDLGGGVHRIPLPMPAGGLRSVNVYAVLLDTGVLMVDAGWATDESEAELARALAELGAGIGDIRRFAITHAHRDHYSLAVRLRDRLGIPASVGIGEQANLLALRTTTAAERAARVGARLARTGAVEIAAEIGTRVRYRDSDLIEYGANPDQWLDGGEVLDGGLLAIPTPGHTHGHVVYHAPDRGLLFSGDHLLPRITPSIVSEPAPAEWPLRDYLDSLMLVRALPDAMLLPAHGPVTTSVHARVDELLQHHEDRLVEALAAVAAGASTAFEAAVGMRWTSGHRRHDELEAPAAGMAVLETGAHLDLLALRGELIREVYSDAVHYRLGDRNG